MLERAGNWSRLDLVKRMKIHIFSRKRINQPSFESLCSPLESLTVISVISPLVRDTNSNTDFPLLIENRRYLPRVPSLKKKVDLREGFRSNSVAKTTFFPSDLTHSDVDFSMECPSTDVHPCR